MKRVLLLIALVAAMCVILSIPVMALESDVADEPPMPPDESVEEEEGEERPAVPQKLMHWSLSDDGELVIFNDCGMRAISYKSWRNSVDKFCVKTVVLQSGVTFIADGAFQGFKNLTAIEIPETVTYIGRDAFLGCDGLIWTSSDVDYVNGWAIGCSKDVQSIVLSENTVGIANYAFADCEALISISLPLTIRHINVSSFFNCSNLISVSVRGYYWELDEALYGGNGTCLIEKESGTLVWGSKNAIIPTNGSVKSIGAKAFYGCSELTEIIIPASVQRIDTYAFSECAQLVRVVFESQSALRTIEAYAFSDCVMLSDIVLPSGVDFIGYAAFWGCVALSDFAVPYGLVCLEGYAFHGCVALQEIALSLNAVQIDASAWWGCRSLSSITVNAHNPVYRSIDNCLITNSGTLLLGCQNSIIPAGVTAIGEYAFYNCAGLLQVSIPASVVEIHPTAFRGCSRVEQINVSAGNTVYQGDANCLVDIAEKTLLLGCENSIIPSNGSVIRIGAYAFYGCEELTNIAIPATVNEISFRAFEACIGLESISFESGEQPMRIMARGFALCESLQVLSFPRQVQRIQEDAFYGCTSLWKVGFAPDSILSYIAYGAFYDCVNLRVIIFPAQLSDLGYGAFIGCTSLNTVYVQSAAMLQAAEQERVSVSFLGQTNTICVAQDLEVPQMLREAYPFVDAVTYQGVSYDVYSVHEHEGAWEKHGDILYQQSCDEGCVIYSDHLFGEWEIHSASHHAASCECGAVIYELHSYGEWEPYTETQHKKVCLCGHEMYSGHVYEAPQQYDEAQHVQRCECGAVKYEAHNWSTWNSKNDMQHKRECACGASEVGAHSWNDGEITTPATHIVEGVKTYTCVDCTKTKTEVVERIPEHNYGVWEIYSEEQHQKTCECGDIVYAEHIHGEWSVFEQDPTMVHKKECVCGHVVYADHASSEWLVSSEMHHKKVCVDCGYILQMKAHIWGVGEITTPATHTTEGVRTYTCVDCGETRTEAVDKTPVHSFGGWQKDSATHHKRDCACGEVERVAHAWNSGEITTPATHTAEGVKTYTCVDCGETRTEAVDKTPVHSFGGWQKDSATHHKRDCACGEVERVAHAWNSGEITTPATHTAEGVKTYTCVDCGETRTEAVDKTPAHSFGEWQKDSATHHKRSCACGEVEHVAHAWNYGEITTPATHTAEGVKTYTCVDCGAEILQSLEKSDAHQYGEWAVVKEATTKEAGIKERSCVCGQKETEEIPQLDNIEIAAIASAGGGVTAVGGGFALWWFIFRKRRLI
ncbi:MAG: leucine-rich repeat domain-containing protein [Ruminococcaceae bacterium]|nr:leucine-rich repeat domain-containing protein [Oscillospiraceae bacterium]